MVKRLSINGKSVKVTIVIPCYNLGLYIKEAITSVMNQTYTDWELIIVNDGSTDEATNTLLANLKYPKTVVFTTKNQGLPATRNFAIGHAKGEYIACLDADDTYDPFFLEKTVQILEADKAQKVGFVTTWAQLFGVKSEIWKTSSYDPILLATKNVVHVASLFRKKCWDDVGGYTELLKVGYQDWDFWIKIVAKGFSWVCIEEALFNYRIREKSMIFFSSQKRPQIYKEIVENNSTFYKKNLLQVIEKFFLAAEKFEKEAFECKYQYETASRQVALQEEVINQKSDYIYELEKAKALLTENVKIKQRYINELEEENRVIKQANYVEKFYKSQKILSESLAEKHRYIEELERANKILTQNVEIKQKYIEKLELIKNQKK